MLEVISIIGFIILAIIVIFIDLIIGVSLLGGLLNNDDVSFFFLGGSLSFLSLQYVIMKFLDEEFDNTDICIGIISLVVFCASLGVYIYKIFLAKKERLEQEEQKQKQEEQKQKQEEQKQKQQKMFLKQINAQNYIKQLRILIQKNPFLMYILKHSFYVKDNYEKNFNEYIYNLLSVVVKLKNDLNSYDLENYYMINTRYHNYDYNIIVQNFLNAKTTYENEKLIEKAYDFLIFKPFGKNYLFYFIIINNILNLFKSNKEFNTILHNLTDKENFDINLATNELYEIYTYCYLNKFNIVLNKIDIHNMLAILIYKEYDYFEINDKYKNKIKIKNSIDNLIDVYDKLNYKNLTKLNFRLHKDMHYSFLSEDFIKYYLDLNSCDEKIFFRILLDDKLKETLARILKINLEKDIEKVEKDIEYKNKVKQIENAKKKILENKIMFKKEHDLSTITYNSIRNGYDFEKFVAKLYSQLGYNVEEVTKKSGDQGADVILEKDGKKYVVQAKFYSSSVGNHAVQEVVAAKEYYNAQDGIVVTNNDFTKSAIELAYANDITLVNGKKIMKYLEKLKTTTVKIEYN